MKRIIALILAFVTCLSLCACGGQGTGAQNSNSKNGGEMEFDTPVIAMDNEYVKIVATGKYAAKESMYGAMGGDVFGYTVIIENKTDKYISLDLVDQSIDGFMLAFNDIGLIETMTIAPGKKANSHIALYADYISAVELTSIDDVINYDASVQIGFSDDGNAYGDHVNDPFENVLP